MLQVLSESPLVGQCITHFDRMGTLESRRGVTDLVRCEAVWASRRVGAPGSSKRLHHVHVPTRSARAPALRDRGLDGGAPQVSMIAAARTVVHLPCLSPTADWVMFMVRTILLEMR